jgi:hypothetical protein
VRHLAILLALIALLMSAEAIAQGTVYGADGKPVARCATGTAQTTCFGADGRAITRESNGTVYDQSGRTVGKITGEKRR